MTFSIPTHKCGLVIGRSRENVKAINQQTGTFMEIFRQLPPNRDPNFKLSSALAPADSIIEEKIEGPLFPVRPDPGGPGPAGSIGPFNPGPFKQGPLGASPHAGGPSSPVPPQIWGNSYPQWQPPAPHDPNKAAAAATDPNAAWATYYSHYYQQPPGPVPGPAPAPAAPPAQGEPPQPPPTGQSDYTKAWEEYYKKIGQQPQQPGAPPQQDYTKAWEEYYKKQAQVATGGGPGAPPGSQPDYSAAWAEYYRQQAAYYGQTPGPGGPQPPPTQQGQQQASGNCHPPPPPFSFQPPATVHPALVGSAGNPFPCGVCP